MTQCCFGCSLAQDVEPELGASENERSRSFDGLNRYWLSIVIIHIVAVIQRSFIHQCLFNSMRERCVACKCSPGNQALFRVPTQ